MQKKWKKLLRQAAPYTKKNHRRRIWQKIVQFMACIVVFCTTYALILPAITLEKTFCGMEEHTHSDACYTKSEENPDTLTCGLAESPGHAHTESCFDENGELVCTEQLEAHTHTERCYGTWTLTCTLPEHTHNTDCTTLMALSEEDRAEVEAVIALIDQLPSYEEITAQLEAFSEAEDSEGEEEYLAVVHALVEKAYRAYMALDEDLREYVTNADKLMELEFIWSVATYAADYTTKVHWVDHYDYDEGLEVGRECSAVVFANEPMNEFGFYYWTGFVIEREGAHFRVKEVLPYETKKTGRTPSGTGYILLIYSNVESKAAVGDYVAFKDFYPDHHYGLSVNGYGNVTFSKNKMVASQAPIVENHASTSAFVNLNLYDYHGDINTNGYTNINTRFLAGNTEYPGFQWNGGAYPYRYRKDAGLAVQNPERDWIASRYYVECLDFGNSYITDYGLDAYFLSDFASAVDDTWYRGSKTSGNIAVAKADASNGLINGIIYGDMYGQHSNTDHPIGVSTKYASIGKMLAYDVNGYYPELGYAATSHGESLRYLFDDTHPGNYAEKKNTQNIDGLFQKNEETGEYYYDSRKNHAQFNTATSRFVLYKQVITPNYILYPFGNFMPLNDITDPESATQVSAFDYQGGVKSYFESVMLEIQSKANLTNSEIQLYRMLLSYRYNWENWANPKRSDGRKWPSITAADTLNDYFDNSSEFGDEGADFYGADLQNLLTRLYNIDYNIPKNFFFGMDMSMHFMQPKDGLTGNDTNKDGTPDYPMVFYFAGDDDVWAYIDDILFLDMTGIHRHVGGKIDFVNGKVYYYAMDSYINGAVEDSPYYSMTFAEILKQHGGIAEADLGKYLKKDSSGNYTTFLDYTTHKFNFYYIERGSGSSVCRINFNFPLLQQNAISVGKELTSTTGVEMVGDPEFSFQIMKADANGNKTTNPFFGEGVTYNIYDSATNTQIGTGTTETYGVFKIKAGQRAEFTGISENSGKYYVREILDKTFIGQYNQISVDGSVITARPDVYNPIDEVTYTGVESPVKDFSDGTTIFTYNNQVDTEKLSYLTITKMVKGVSSDVEKTLEFDMMVELNGALKDTEGWTPIPVGTPYTLYRTDEFINNGQKVKIEKNPDRVVTKEGIVTVPGGATAEIDYMIPGTTWRVYETSGSAEGYTVGYGEFWGGDWITAYDNRVEGTIPVYNESNLDTAHVCMTVTNIVPSGAVTIPATKTLFNGSADPSTPHTYSFTIKLESVMDYKTGNYYREDQYAPYSNTKEIQVTGNNPANFNFMITYSANDFPKDAITVLTYSIKENKPDELESTHDTAEYEAIVVVTRKSNGSLYPAPYLHSLTKNGQTVNSAAFTNILLGDLTLEKQVVGGSLSQENSSFNFSVQIGTNSTTALKDWTVQVIKNGVVQEPMTTDSDGFLYLTGIKHGDKVQLKGIPLGCVWEITEADTDGYLVTWTANGVSGSSNVANGDIPAGGMEVVYTNTSTYALPETGGVGTSAFYILGVLVMLAAAVLAARKRRPIG